MSEIEFAVEMVRGVPVVTAPEEIDIKNAPWLRSAVLEAVAHGDGTLVVDLTRTRFCDVSGLRILLAAHEQVQAAGGRLLLAVTGAAVLRAIALTGLDGKISKFASLDEAVAQATGG